MTKTDEAAPPPNTLAVLLEDTPGALDRVLGAVRRQGCVVRTIAYGPSERAGVSRMTLTVTGGNATRLQRNLARLVSVITASDVTGSVGGRPIDGAAASIPFHHQADGASERDEVRHHSTREN